MSISIEMEPPLLMSLLLLGVASIFTALGDEVSVKLKQGMVSCDDRDREVCFPFLDALASLGSILESH